jgi:hypothetical protein
MKNLINKLNEKHVDNYAEWLKKTHNFEWEFEHWSGPNLTGKLLWTNKNHNIVVNSGLQESIDVTLLNGTQSPSWYIVPTTGTPTFAAADTPASHAGWTENEDYDEAVRQTWTGVRTGQVVTNSASPGVINITAGSTFGGAALLNNSTKGGTTGIMFSGVVATEGDQVLGAGGSLSMVYSITAADDGA